MLSQTGPGPSMGDLLTCSTSMGAFSFHFFWHIKVQRYTPYRWSVWTVVTGNMLVFVFCFVFVSPPMFFNTLF